MFESLLSSARPIRMIEDGVCPAKLIISHSAEVCEIHSSGPFAGQHLFLRKNPKHLTFLPLNFMTISPAVLEYADICCDSMN